ncbi:MAG: DUF268 domain-containing protein, partial [Desulfatitalea sp.]|nr:DUF268 domain-containing protein [Desulfatitalea sp.]NNK02377.1 DUF268 domain-containing protein [Desulfatitalea sp.]
VQSLLDVGCGYGRFCHAATQFVPKVMGLDIASVASGNVIGNPAIEFIDGEAKRLPLPDHAVEWITSFDCLEHCLEEDIDTVLSEFDRVATKGFVLSISYDPDYLADVPLHMTVKPEPWWLEKLSRFGEVTHQGRVPITGVPYLVCRKPTAKRLICYCVGGLGNRLLPLAACHALARQSGRQLAMLWRDTDFRCQARFDELFENSIPMVGDDELAGLTSCKIYADQQDIDFEAQLNGTHALKGLARQHGFSDRNQITLTSDGVRDVIIYHNNLVPGAAREEIIDFFRQLRPVQALREQIAQLAQALGLDDTVVGVHARGTDFNVQVATYAERIALHLREHPRQRFFVSSDDAAYETHLKSYFPHNIIVRPKTDCVRRADPTADWTNNTLTSNAAIREAIIDIHLLARTDFRIFHEGSSFAQLVNLLKAAGAGSQHRSAPVTPPRAMPETLRAAYTMGGQIPVTEGYFDESGRDANLHYDRTLMDRLMEKAHRREACNYGDTDQWLYQMLDRFPITGQRVLVMGSQVPFYEAVCLARGARPTTVEFEKIRSDHPDHDTLTVEALGRSTQLYDAAIAISTFEHTGLGRYGDPLDPDGDLAAMRMLRTKVRQDGLLFLSVPMREDTIVWNAHRIYGKVRFPHLVAGWEVLASAGKHAESETYRDLDYFQPIFVLRNDIETHIDMLIDLFKSHLNPVFIETGTALGRGVKAALRAGFNTVISVEQNGDLAEFNRARFADDPRVTIIHGESLSALSQILADLDTPATFWLDAHRTGGGLDGGGAPYPLLEELRAIQRHPIRRHTLLIDDRRLFEQEFGIHEDQVRSVITSIDPGYRFSDAHSTPESVPYGRNDILVAEPPAETVTTSRTSAPQTKGRIFYFCPDIPLLSAGIRRLYRHVAALAQNGFSAAILHQQGGFKAPDQPEAPIVYWDDTRLTERDVVVIPEGQPQIMHALRDVACRRFVIALNWDYIFKSLPDEMDWRHFNIERVMVVSPFIGRMVSWAMRLPIHLLDSAIDGDRFRYVPEQKQHRVAYIQRKAACIEPLQRLLAARNRDYTERIQWRPLTGLPQNDYAREVCSASIFLNLSPAEGFPTSCMEAMAAGTVVAGFDGVGGRELLVNGENCILAPNGDYVSLAYAVAPLLDNLLNGGSAAWEPLRAKGLETTAPLTRQRETRSVVDFWKSVL